VVAPFAQVVGSVIGQAVKFASFGVALGFERFEPGTEFGVGVGRQIGDGFF
jgi:hypothetical protein